MCCPKKTTPLINAGNKRSNDAQPVNTSRSVPTVIRVITGQPLSAQLNCQATFSRSQEAVNTDSEKQPREESQERDAFLYYSNYQNRMNHITLGYDDDGDEDCCSNEVKRQRVPVERKTRLTFEVHHSKIFEAMFLDDDNDLDGRDSNGGVFDGDVLDFLQ